MSTSPEHFLRTVSSPKQIHDHPLNQSPAKMLYSFPHAERFPRRNFASPCGEAFYDIKEAAYRSKRACSLGKGMKYDFTKNGKAVPAPNSYYPLNLTVGFEKKRGFSFGLSRESAPQHGIAPFLKSAAANPGPGAYVPVPAKSHKSITFRIKLEKHFKDNKEVGPGKYDVPTTFEPAKRIFNSKFQSTKSIRFAPLKLLMNEKEGKQRSESADSKGKENMGPNIAYDTKYQINKVGQFFNSKYKNSKCRIFGKASRDSMKKFSDVPGPGNYVLPSEFGLYESANVLKTDK